MMNPRKKILLINPPYTYFRFRSQFISNYSRPPLGVAYLASYLREKLDCPHEIKIIDCTVEALFDPKEIVALAASYKPDLVGFSVVTPAYDVVTEISKGIKSALPACRIVKGGPHITALPEEVDTWVDAKILGEGEETLLRYIKAEILNVDSEPTIEGLIKFKDGQPQTPPQMRPLIDPLDKLPLPARDLLALDKYFHTYPYRSDSRFTTMMISRGCPYTCSFCASNRLWQRKVRFHTPDRINAELEELTGKFKINLICFDDDSFLLNNALSLSVMDSLEKNFPDLLWICHARATEINEGIAEAMARSGCKEVQVGVESGNQHLLDAMSKGITIEDIRTAFKVLKKNKIKSWATFVLGTPDETQQTFAETVTFAKEIDPTYSSFILLLPFPGSQLYDDYKQRGWLRSTRWGDFNWYSVPVFITERLSQNDLMRMQKSAYLAFYLRPKKLFSILKDVLKARSFREIVRSFIAWLSILFNRAPRSSGA
jgi:anaerobic magnesium-protoporphyrin IX monomethyl ester cyclase